MINNHLNKLKSLLIDQNLDAILISSPANLYYISGFVCLSPLEQEAYVLITKQQAYLITNPLYAGDTFLSPEISLYKTTNISFDEAIILLLEKHSVKKIGFEEYFLTVAEYNQMHKQIPNCTWIPVNLRNLRIQKTPQEISFIEKACKIGDSAFSFILNKIKSGISEKQIAGEMEIFIRKKGATLSFPSIIAFGKNAAIPHHVTSNQKIEKNNFLLLDFGVKIDEYCSDMTRTIYIGNPSNEEKRMYETVLESQEKAIEYIQKTQNTQSSENSEYSVGQKIGNSDSQIFRQSDVSGIPSFPSIPKIQASYVDKTARDYILSQNFPDFPHTLGHGIGLAVHEAPSLSAHSKDKLRTGMIFSIEPGIYLQGKTGIRIEDLMVIEGNRSRLLTKAPKELITI